ncbi:glycosyl transferase [Georgenia sp. 10Sc9-8]|uniref:Glycosyl transferase n=1 Tax=Georgenia halotolerans TaxID=3028317 RepID=A0ABT5U092_9MICO|nr:glycosyl transferase [Georgenia halotolerans]
MSEPIRALWFSREPGARTNPYLIQLFHALPDEVRAAYFTWPRALTGRYDVAHVHWPEVMLSAPSPKGRLKRRLLYALLMLRLRLSGIPVVRTLHNLEPHEGASRLDGALLDAMDRRTRVWIRLSDRTPEPPTGACVTIPHGHYRDWYVGHPAARPMAGRMAYVGLIRPYKGVEELLNSIRENGDRTLSLHVSGHVADEELRERVTALAGEDERIALDLRYLADEEMVAEVTSAELVVLPYRRMHNSGALLLALSLGRPVLVPSSPVNEEISAEVGPGWVSTYDGALTGSVLTNALANARSLPSEAVPDLSRRSWPEIGRAHAVAYATAVSDGTRSRRTRLRL